MNFKNEQLSAVSNSEIAAVHLERCLKALPLSHQFSRPSWEQCYIKT